jgi:DNA primase
MLSGKSILERLSLEPEEALPEHVLRKYRQSVMHPYWGERGFDNNIVEKWDLGYDPMRNAVTIPYRNHMGRLRGIIRRYLDHDVRVRYKYPKGSKISEILFGAWRSYDMPIFICEGSLDAIKLDQFGMSAVAILGSRISDYQVGELRRMGATDIILMLDNDRAGQEAEAAIYDRLKHEQFVLNLRRVDGKMFGRRKDGVKAKDPGEMKPKKLRALADRYT